MNINIDQVVSELASAKKQEVPLDPISDNRKMAIRSIFKNFKAFEVSIERNYIVENQRIISEWATKNNINLDEISEDDLRSKVEQDDSIKTQLAELAENANNSMEVLLEQFVRAIDKSKIDFDSSPIIIPR